MVKEKDKHKGFGDQSVNGKPQEACENPGAAGADNVADESFEADDKTACAADEWKDKYMRLSAEFDNFRKRTLREKMEIIAAGGEEVIKPLLGVMDDFDRALLAMERAQDVAAVREGVELIRQKFMDTLRSRGVSEVDAQGLPLDTDLHDAVAQLPVEDPKMRGRIVDVVQKGYKLKDKVIRHSKVVVGE